MQQAELKWELNKWEEERKAAEAEAKRKADEAEQQRLAAAKAEQERQARAAEAEAKRKADEAEQQTLAAAKAEEEQAKPKADEEQARAFNNRGRAYAEKSQFHRAIADYTVAIQLNPNYALAFCNRGKAKLNINDSSSNADIAKARQLDASVCR